MQITDDQSEKAALAALTLQAGRLLCAGEFQQLAEVFGYALAYGREPATAIREELEQSLAELGATSLAPVGLPAASVSYFQPNDTGLFASTEQLIPTDGRGHILVELVVGLRGSEKHVYLEQVSASA